MKFIVVLIVIFAAILIAGHYLAPRLPGYGQLCGGIANIECPKYFKCEMTASYGPDAAGICKPSFLPF